MEELAKVLATEEEDKVALERIIEFAICALSTRPTLTRQLLYKLSEVDSNFVEQGGEFYMGEK